MFPNCFSSCFHWVKIIFVLISSFARHQSDAEGNIRSAIPLGIVLERLEAHAEGYPRATAAARIETPLAEMIETQLLFCQPIYAWVITNDIRIPMDQPAEKMITKKASTEIAEKHISK